MTSIRRKAGEIKATQGQQARFWIGMQLPLAKKALTHCETEGMNMSEFVRYLITRYFETRQ